MIVVLTFHTAGERGISIPKSHELEIWHDKNMAIDDTHLVT